MPASPVFGDLTGLIGHDPPAKFDVFDFHKTFSELVDSLTVVVCCLRFFIFTMPRQRPRVHWLVNNQQASQFADRRNRYTLRGAYIRGDLSVDLHKGGRDRSDHVGGRQMIEAMGLGGAVSIDAERVLPYADAQASASDGKRDMPPQVMSKSLETGFRDFRLHWKKVVGEGGYGLITLWEVELEDGHREDVIIKMGRTSDTNLHEELSWHLRYNLASSIVQARDLVKMADRHRRGNRFRRGEEFSPRRENVLVLEYMSLGNLCSVFQKTKMLGRQFPSNALWQLWECCKHLVSGKLARGLTLANIYLSLIVVLGIAEVAYQEVIRQHYNQGFTGAFRRHIDAGGQFVEEFFDAVETFPISHDVHFDLEENNSMF